MSHNVSEKQGLSREAARKLIHKLDSKHSQELLDQIIEVVQKVPGVSEVNSEIVIGPPLYAGGLNRPRS